MIIINPEDVLQVKNGHLSIAKNIGVSYSSFGVSVLFFKPLIRTCFMNIHIKLLANLRARKLIEAVAPELFCEKGVLKNFAKFIGKHLCGVSFLMFRCLKPETKLKKKLQRGVFL